MVHFITPSHTVRPEVTLGRGLAIIVHFMPFSGRIPSEGVQVLGCERIKVLSKPLLIFLKDDSRQIYGMAGPTK